MSESPLNQRMENADAVLLSMILSLQAEQTAHRQVLKELLEGQTHFDPEHFYEQLAGLKATYHEQLLEQLELKSPGLAAFLSDLDESPANGQTPPPNQ